MENNRTQPVAQQRCRLIRRYPSTAIFFIGLATLLFFRLLSLYTLNAAATAKGTVYTSLFLYFTRSMFITGPTVFPYLHHSYYPDYLATTTFFSYLTSLPFGHATLFTISIPYCIAGALLLVFTYRIGALHNKHWGLYGVLFALLTWKFVEAIHAFALDIFPALATVITFYLLYSADLHQRYRRLWWLPLVFLFGFLTRGPIGLIVPTAVASGYYLFTWRWKKLMILAVLSIMLLIAATAAMLGLAYHIGGPGFLHTVILQEGLARVSHHHGSRVYFYFTNGLFNYFISALFAVMVIAHKRRLLFTQRPLLPSQQLLRQLAFWFILLLCAFTLINSKKARYVLAIVPAISLLAAYPFVYEQAQFKKVQTLCQLFLRGLPLVGLIIAIALPIYNYNFPHHPVYAAFFPAGIFFLTMIVIHWLTARYLTRQRIILLMMLGIISLAGLNVLFVEPILFHPTGEQILAASQSD